MHKRLKQKLFPIIPASKLITKNKSCCFLQIHNINNDNNIALSPYGAASVLVALAEGLRGDAALEIYHAAHIPHDLTIIRIGLRDIHRHLKVSHK